MKPEMVIFLPHIFAQHWPDLPAVIQFAEFATDEKDGDLSFLTVSGHELAQRLNMDLLFLHYLVCNVVSMQISIQRHKTIYFIWILAEIAAAAHYHLPKHIFILRWVSQDEMFQEDWFVESGVSYQLPCGGKVDSLDYFALDHFLFQSFAGLRELWENAGLIWDHYVDETVSQVVDIAKNPVFEVDSREAYGVPNLRAEEVGLTLDEGVQ